MDNRLSVSRDAQNSPQHSIRDLECTDDVDIFAYSCNNAKQCVKCNVNPAQDQCK